MADKEETKKATAVDLFRKQLMNREQITSTITEGLKNVNGKVRSLAIKMAFKTQDHAFLKQNVLPLIKNDKSKKVLRALSEKVTRKDLIAKLKTLAKAKAAAAKKEGAEAQDAPKPPA